MTEIQQSLFDYTSLDADTAKLAKESAIEIKARERVIWENIIEIGNWLIEVKEVLPHGQFEGWIQSEFDWHPATARKYMIISKEIDLNRVYRHDFPTSMKALYQLASGLSKADEETKEQILETVEQKTEEKGESLTEKQIKEITKEYESKIKELENKQTVLLSDRDFLQSQVKQKEIESKISHLYLSSHIY